MDVMLRKTLKLLSCSVMKSDGGQLLMLWLVQQGGFPSPEINECIFSKKVSMEKVNDQRACLEEEQQI